MLNKEEPIKDRCDECMKKFGFLAACKYHYNALEIMKRLKDDNIFTEIKTINDYLFHVVMV